EERTVTGGMNGRTVTLKPLSVVHRRDKVRPDHRPRERLRAQWGHCLQQIALAHGHMHVEGREKKKAPHACRSIVRSRLSAIYRMRLCLFALSVRRMVR